METQQSTQQHILDAAFELMQRCGYNAFSYADIAERVGIRKASIHHYFPAKSDLARSVVARYRVAGREGIEHLRRTVPEPAQQLEYYVAFVGEEIQGQPRICLCALLAGEMLTLPNDVRAEIQGYYQEQTAWLAGVLQAGHEAGTLRFKGTPEAAAQALLAGFQGAMLAARAHGDVEHFRTIGAYLLAQLQTAQ